MTSRTDSPLASATARMLSLGDCSRLTLPAASGPDGQLLHVDARTGVEHGAPFAHRDDRQGAAPAQGGRRGAVDGVDGDVGVRRGAVADLLAVVEHRRFVLLALADDDHAVHRHAAEHDAHGVDRRAVGALLVAAAHPAGRRHGRRLGHPDQLQGQVAVRRLRAATFACTHAGDPSARSRADVRRPAVRLPGDGTSGRPRRSVAPLAGQRFWVSSAP